ncbi:MAG: cation:proton antiporter [Bacteroidales bacterium]
MGILSIQIPFVEPVIIIALVLTIILIGPVVFERVRIPSIVGLLLSGALIGQHGFNLVGSDLEFSLLGTMGLLYLMFLAGLEIDLIDFIENKLKSIFIGLASFLVPFLLGFLVSRHLLDYSVYASWLIGAMLSSHTLISYPLMGRLGIINRSIVTIIVGATIIADILALISMELIINFADKGLEINAMLHLLLSFLLFFLFIFLVIPRLSRYFLDRYEGELGVQYIFVLVMLFMSAAIAFLLDIEPILGAFFSGLVLNRQIINTSPLYKRIEFIGQNLFIPFFLISIGMLANFRVYIDDPRQVWLLFILIAVAVLSKYLASFLSKLVFRLSGAETNLVFGMSVSRAASAVAIILIGFNMGLISESILNNTVILILVTSILSTYITQKAGTQILLKGNDTVSGEKRMKQKILVPIANPANMAHLLEFAVLIKRDDDHIPIYPLTVFTQKDQVRTQIDNNQGEILKVIDSLQTDVDFETGSRIDNSVTNGIVRAAEEIVATAIIMGWNNRSTPFYTLFGNVLSNLLRKTQRMLLVLKTPSELKKVRSIHLFCADNAQYEEGFSLWMDTLMHMIKRLQIKVILYCESQSTFDAIVHYSKDNKNSKYIEEKKSFVGKLATIEMKQSTSDLLIFIHSRKKSVSYSRKYENFLNSNINRYKENNIIIVYPEQ